MSNDLGFLLIFIILPTALIVSGIWFLLLFRREARTRDLTQTITPSGDQADDLASEGGAESGPDTPVGIAALPDSALVGPQSAGSLATDEDEDEEFWTDPAEIETVAAESDSETASEPEYQPDFTEEIAPLDAGPGIDDPSDLSDGPLANDAVASPADESDSTASPTGSEDDGEPNEQPDRRRRQPGARLVPSSEYVKQRTGTTGRRAPQIPKSSGRDEDTMESPDGRRDV